MTEKRLRIELAKYNLSADILHVGRFYHVIIDAPEGKLFSSRGIHSLVHHTLTGFTEVERSRVRSEALENAILSLPLENCNDPNCPVCER